MTTGMLFSHFVMKMEPTKSDETLEDFQVCRETSPSQDSEVSSVDMSEWHSVSVFGRCLFPVSFPEFSHLDWIFCVFKFHEAKFAVVSWNRLWPHRPVFQSFAVTHRFNAINVVTKCRFVMRLDKQNVCLFVRHGHFSTYHPSSRFAKCSTVGSYLETHHTW
jgi:hypothetical protein